MALPSPVEPSGRVAHFSLPDFPCPACHSGDNDTRGRGTRCETGYPDSFNARYFHCGRLSSSHPDASGRTWLHVYGPEPCHYCGQAHDARGEASPLAIVAKPLREIHGRRYLPATLTEGFTTYAFAEDSDFTTADGTLRYVERRYERPAADGGKPDKTVRQYSHRGGDVWVAKLETEPLLWNLPAIATAPIDAPIYVFEGPRKARIAQEALREAGALGVCTSASGGSKGPVKTVDLSALRGRRAIIVRDHDADGEAYAETFARRAQEAGAAQAAILLLPNLPDAGDVVEYLATGHDGADLARLAMAAPIFNARMVESQTSSPALNLETQETQQLRKQCAQLRATLKIAEATIARQRLRLDAHRAILRAPKEQLPASLKPAAIATYDALTSIKPRDEEGRMRVSCLSIAKRTGAAVKTTGTQMRALDSLRLIDSKPVHILVEVPVVTEDGSPVLMPDGSPATRTETRTELHVKEGPFFAKPQELEVNELAKRHGGARPRCKSCGSHNLQATSYTCRNCGERMTRAEAQEAGAAQAAQNQTASPLLNLETQEDEPSDCADAGDSDDLQPDSETPDSLPPQEYLSSVPTSGSAGNWIGSPDPTCDHDYHPRRTLKSGREVCGHCGARYVPPLDSAEVRDFTQRSGRG